MGGYPVEGVTTGGFQYAIVPWEFIPEEVSA